MLLTYKVIQGGNAEKCGLKVGDELKSMNGQMVLKMNLSQAQEVIKTAKTKFSMDINRMLIYFYIYIIIIYYIFIMYM